MARIHKVKVEIVGIDELREQLRRLREEIEALNPPRDLSTIVDEITDGINAAAAEGAERVKR